MPVPPSVEIPFTEYVVPQLLAWREAGVACALLTLVRVEGPSPRRIGSQMAVSARGDHVGYISSGCAEAAIIAEALDVITSRVARTVRYGAGSQYLDIVLPCGAGIDIHFDPLIPTSLLAGIDARMRAREPVALAIDLASGASAIVTRPDLQEATTFCRPFQPSPRIVIAGRGVGVDYLAAGARLLAWEVVAASPDQDTLTRVSHLTAKTQHLTRADDFELTLIDRFSAVVLLFHDHDWEPPILARCEASPAFYVGALGSRRTHAQRRMLLEDLGCSQSYLDAIRSPVGLSIGARNPPEIALAILAEIVAAAGRLAQA